ncbi:quinone oxidoreductase [Rothia sp. LK2588]|uniref:quinone oxidoreductase n=1 Tax=Rothia sp. LK2588 TaxID=3114369 RepID=UPI0034CFCE8C
MNRADLPAQHTAVTVTETGDPGVLTIDQAELPQPGPTEVLVKTAAAGVNFIDTYQRSGVYPMQLPYVPGTEASGTVVAVGDQVNTVSVGDRVATCMGNACYAQYFTVDEKYAAPIPDGVSDDIAAALPLQGATAHYLLRSTFKVKPEHTVLFHAGAGGVGGLALQLLKRIGATVITTVSTDEKEQIARAHGADHVIRYENFGQRVRELTDGAGVDVVYDSVGRDTFEESLGTLKPRGMAVLFGGASGQVPPFDLQQLNRLGSLYVTRPSLGHYVASREEFTWRMSELFDAVATGELKVTVDQRFPLSEAAAAHEYLEARKTRGKVLLIP